MFQKVAMRVASVVGSPVAFALAFIVVLLWAVSGPFLGFSDVWQLTINTATTIVTFLMVFLIQASQNNDTRAIHIKLDEVLLAIENADNAFIGIEQLPPEERQKLTQKLEEVASHDSERRPTGN